MTSFRRLFYKSHGAHLLKKRYRYKKGTFPDRCIDASKLPADLDLSGVEIRLGVNIHSEKFPIFDFVARLEKGSRSYIGVTNIENAPVPILNKFIEAVKRHEKIYYRALKELGNSGNLLKDLGL